jgi:hypothetical protein
VNGTEATLNSGDSLTGGAGTDVLALFGSGTFRVDQLATFAGFETITLNNYDAGWGRPMALVIAGRRLRQRNKLACLASGSKQPPPKVHPASSTGEEQREVP